MAEQLKAELIPALIFAGKESALKIAALTVLDRLVVAIHRGGAGPITIVTEKALPELKRARALGIAVEVVPVTPRVEGSVLIADGNVLAQAADVRRCLEQEGRLSGRQGAEGIEELLPIGVLAGAQVKLIETMVGQPPCVGFVEATLAGVRRIESRGVAHLIHDKRSAKNAEKALWATMWSSSDGLVDRVFNRPVGRFLSKVLIFTPVSPNMISIASILIGVIAAVFLAEGRYRWALIGAILFQISAIVDCVDGDIARMLFKESPLGKWIDLAGDQIVHISIFSGIAFGVMRNGGGKEALWLGVSAVVGALISFAVVLRGMRQPAGTSGPLQKLIDAATNRDFSVIVLVLAIVQKLPLFLWMAGIGSHLFWITAFGLQLAQKRDRAVVQAK